MGSRSRAFFSRGCWSSQSNSRSSRVGFLPQSGLLLFSAGDGVGGMDEAPTDDGSVRRDMAVGIFV